jgi:hypothetical protein
MSYGFIRKMSPAAKSEAERRKRARRLTALKIDSVDSVDKGAAHGATVELLKGHKMPTEMTLRQQLQAALDDGDVTKAAVITKGIALQDFPESKNWGVALSKWNATAEGQAVTAAMARMHYAKEQFRTATGNGYGISKAMNEKARGIAHSDVDCEDSWEKMVNDTMAKLGCNRSQAIDHVNRDERGQKALRKSLVFYNPPED